VPIARIPFHRAAARSVGRLIVALLAVAALLAGLQAAPARAGVANAGLSGPRHADPLAGLPWGNYSGPQDEVFPAYDAASGHDRVLLARIALRPRARWFGAWYSDAQIGPTIGRYLANVTGGNPDVMAQAAVFRLVPWEHAACSQLPTAAQQASYRTWIANFAAAVGSARLAVILQPDLPFALCAPGRGRLDLQLVAAAARTLTALPHTTVYIDVGAADWPSVGQAVSLLRAAGVAAVRGFALNATHYDATSREIEFGARVARGLAREGIPNRHFVINTASNGRPFTYQQHPGAIFDNAPVCRSRASRACVTLGIPPTWQVSSPRWGLSRTDRALADRYVDAYLWYGRPWLDNQSDPFDLRRSLQLAATTPF
jgi:endoglucanase